MQAGSRQKHIDEKLMAVLQREKDDLVMIRRGNMTTRIRIILQNVDEDNGKNVQRHGHCQRKKNAVCLCSGICSDRCQGDGRRMLFSVHNNLRVLRCLMERLYILGLFNLEGVYGCLPK